MDHITPSGNRFSDVTIIESKIVIAIILNNRIESKWQC